MKQRSPEWYAARKGRLTGSNVGAALGIDPNKTPDDLIRQMVREYHGAPMEFTGNIATEYGTLHEPLAVLDYIQKTGNAVDECGFFGLEFDGMLIGASPDGLIGTETVLEIKCPFGLRNEAKPVFKPISSQPHYYAQVQFEMFCSERTNCHFYQWCQNGDSIEIIELDTDWLSENWPALSAFYKWYLSELDNPAHLEAKHVEINTLEADKLLKEYDAMCEQEDAAAARKKEIMASLIAMSGERNALVCGRKLTEIERKGNVNYAKIPELKGVDLEQYRGKSSKYWRLS